MKYIIMAGGKGQRWNNSYERTKHLMEVNGETLLSRIVRQLKDNKIKDIYIRSNNPAHNIEGTIRVPLVHKDNKAYNMFCYELLFDETVFLYGDTFYEDSVMKTIIKTPTKDVLFIGTESSIVGIKVKDYELFKKHLEKIKDFHEEYIRGWTVYQSINKLHINDKTVLDNYLLVEERVANVNTKEDYLELKESINKN